MTCVLEQLETGVRHLGNNVHAVALRTESVVRPSAFVLPPKLPELHRVFEAA